MADFINNNADLIKNMLTVVGAAITLLLTILTLFRNREKPAITPIDSPSIKIIKIKRYPLDEKEWKQFRFSVKLILGLYLLQYIAFFTLAISSLMQGGIGLSILVFIASIYLLILLLKNYSKDISTFILIKSRIEAEYFIFKYIEIIIQCDYHYLFNKCHETLRKMKYIVLEVDEKMGIIRVEKRGYLKIRSVLKVQIKNVENETKEKVVEDKAASYLVKLDFIDFVKEAEKPDTDISANKSRVTNFFLNELISKPKDAHI